MMEDKEVINISLIDMKHQKITDVHYADITLYDSYLQYRGKMECEETKDLDDPMLGVTESEYEWETYVRKSSIASIDFDLGTPDDFQRHWSVTVTVAGRPSDLHIYFSYNDKEGARDLYDRLVKWFMSPYKIVE